MNGSSSITVLNKHTISKKVFFTINKQCYINTNKITNKHPYISRRAKTVKDTASSLVVLVALTELRFQVPQETKEVMLETIFPANVLTYY